MPNSEDKLEIFLRKSHEYGAEIREKERRIVALETENAMLYLKLAQLQSELKSQKEKSGHWRRLFQAEYTEKRRSVQMMMAIQQQVKDLRQDNEELRLEVSGIPLQFLEICDDVMDQVGKHNKWFALHHDSMSEIQKKLLETELALQSAMERHAKEKRRRRELHNTLMELRGNIRVHCRIRPLLEFDTGTEDVSSLGRVGSVSEVVVHCMDDENVCIKTAKYHRLYEFERLYSPVESQEAIFEEVQPMMTSLLDGYNVCIMAYGQTGSGKTHTMLGSHKNDDYNPSKEPHPDEGVIPRAARELFTLINERPPGSCSVEVSVVEIYNNDIRDLLSSDPNAKHDIVAGVDNSMIMPTVISRSVDSVYDVMCLVQHGLRTRRETATQVHEHSSRSHLVVTLTVNINPNSLSSPGRTASPDVFAVPQSPAPRARRQLPQPQVFSYTVTNPVKFRSRSPSPQRSQTPTSPSMVRTKLQLVDLAGSECVGMSGVTGESLREACYINKSLSALADVLGALAEHRAHVPYRNSRLTHLLQDSIGGNAKLLVMLCVSPSQRYITESLQCLGFGHRARQVQRGPIRRKLPPTSERATPISFDGPLSGRNSPRPRSTSGLPLPISSARKERRDSKGDAKE